MAEMLAIPMTAEMIPLVRQSLEATPRPTDDDLGRQGTFTVQERVVPGPAGDPDISLLVCRPTAATEPTAAIFYAHGGGMIAGDNRHGIVPVLDWAEQLQLTVVSVEYRLAPEAPHPGPVEDCYAGLMWTVAHADQLGIDTARIVVAGESAGAGLAAALALMARDRGEPTLAGQLLIQPMLDDRNDSISSQQMTGVGAWDRHANGVAWTALLGEDRGGPDVPPYAAPARAADLSGLPPAFIDVGSADTFRDEAVAYASRLWHAGGRAELHVWPGGCHGFDLMVPDAPISTSARKARLSWLRRLVAP
jgi:acetyl esterase/lipase